MHWKAVIPGTDCMTTGLQEVDKQFDLCAPGGLQAVETVSESLCSGGTTSAADEELSIKR